MEQLSIVVNITDKEKADWIWNDKLQGNLGISVRAISNGHLMRRSELYKEKSELLEETAEYSMEVLNARS